MLPPFNQPCLNHHLGHLSIKVTAIRTKAFTLKRQHVPPALIPSVSRYLLRVPHNHLVNGSVYREICNVILKGTDWGG